MLTERNPEYLLFDNEIQGIIVSGYPISIVVGRKSEYIQEAIMIQYALSFKKNTAILHKIVQSETAGR